MTCPQLFLRPRLRPHPRTYLRPNAHAHVFAHVTPIASPVICNLSWDTLHCLLQAIMFCSSTIGCYFVSKTCPQSFLGPSLNLRPGQYAHIYAHCSHPHPFIHLFQLSYFHFPLMTCLQLFFRPRLHLCPRAYGHASTPTFTPIAQ